MRPASSKFLLLCASRFGVRGRADMFRVLPQVMRNGWRISRTGGWSGVFASGQRARFEVSGIGQQSAIANKVLGPEVQGIAIT